MFLTDWPRAPTPQSGCISVFVFAQLTIENKSSNMFLTHTPTRALHTLANILPHPTHPQHRFEIIKAQISQSDPGGVADLEKRRVCSLCQAGHMPTQALGQHRFLWDQHAERSGSHGRCWAWQTTHSLRTARSGGRPAKSVVPAAALESPWAVRPVCCFRGPGSCIKLGRAPHHPLAVGLR